MSVKVIQGDCLEVMPSLSADSVDAVITDPPYGLAFMGKHWDHGIPGADFWIEAIRVAKPGAHLLAFGGTRTFHRLTVAIEDAGWEIRDCLSWIYGSGFPKSLNIGDGRGTALKPAWEPIILARKPFRQTVAANVQEHGTGALNIDACRIEASGRPHIESKSERSLNAFGDGLNGSRLAGTTDLGRWPANVVLDDEAAAMLDEQSGDRTAGGNLTGSEPSRPFATCYGEMDGRRVWNSYADVGGASRFFYTSKAGRAERNNGLAGFEERMPDNAIDRGTQRIGQENAPGRGSLSKPRANHHPTVKPLDLMRWLVRLVTPPNGVVLDPFCGSGSTGCAAVLEGKQFIGIEKEAEYVTIAEKRIAHWGNQLLLGIVA